MSDLRVLIIEDNEDVANIYSTGLKECGFETEIIRSGDVALTRLAATLPDLVILDLSLPRISGEEILRRMRADARLARTRVIVVTAYPEVDDDLREAADVVLVKPVTFGQLRDLAARLCPADN